MATITPIQAYAAARAAGFPPATARQMVAIAQRESSLNPGVVGTINAAKETSYGLWQINWKDAGIRALLQRNGITDPAQLYDPATNARAAALLWGGNDNNLNTAWYINRTGNQYGYAEKYQQNLANLPAVEDLEAVYTGAGRLGGGGGGNAPVTTTAAGALTIPLTTGNGYDYSPAPGAPVVDAGDGNGGGGGNGGGAGGGNGLDLSAFGFDGNGAGVGPITGLELSPAGWGLVAAVGLFIWWWGRDRN